MIFLETSAKTAANVEAAFLALASELIKNRNAVGAANAADVGGQKVSLGGGGADPGKPKCC